MYFDFHASLPFGFLLLSHRKKWKHQDSWSCHYQGSQKSCMNIPWAILNEKWLACNVQHFHALRKGQFTTFILDNHCSSWPFFDVFFSRNMHLSVCGELLSSIKKKKIIDISPNERSVSSSTISTFFKSHLKLRKSFYCVWR